MSLGSQTQAILNPPASSALTFDGLICKYTYMNYEKPEGVVRDPTDVAACTFANLRKATRVVTQHYEAALRPLDLTATQFTMLAMLDWRGPLRLTDLAVALVMDRTTLTRNLKPLTARGLIQVGADTDRRVRRLSISQAGRALLKKAIPQWHAAQAALVDGLGSARWANLLDDLDAAVALTHGP